MSSALFSLSNVGVAGEPGTGKSSLMQMLRSRVPSGFYCVSIGVPRDEIARLGERFYRVDKTRSRELGGTGLGLSIVKHLMAAHGGRMEIESQLGRGTTVSLYFPVWRDAA